MHVTRWLVLLSMSSQKNRRDGPRELSGLTAVLQATPEPFVRAVGYVVDELENIQTFSNVHGESRHCWTRYPKHSC